MNVFEKFDEIPSMLLQDIKETRIDVYETLCPNRCLYIKVAKLRTGVGSAEMSHLQNRCLKISG